MPLKERDDRTYTYRDYLTWPADERWELLAGRAVYIGPAPSDAHQRVVGELFRQIANQLIGHRCQVRTAPYDVRLDAGELAENGRSVVQPDILLVCDADKLDERGCKGPPDWIIEVVSPSTAGRDYIAKRRLYERFGVREYWIVHPVDKVVTAYRLNETGAYAEPAFYAADTGEADRLSRAPSAVIADLEIELEWI
jgi:Uma2 family endonuclease